MTKPFQSLALAAILLAPAAPVSAQITLGIHIGEPPAPHAYVVPPYAGAYWVEAYHTGGQYYAGRWEGSRGYVTHDHRWDASKQRDDHRKTDRNDHDDRR